MDINFKNKGLLHASIVTILVAIIFALVTVSIYIPLTENKKGENDFSTYLKSRDFAYSLGDYTNHILRDSSVPGRRSNYFDVDSIQYYFTKQGDEGNVKTNIDENVDKAMEDGLHHFTFWFDDQGEISQKGTIEVDRHSFETYLEMLQADASLDEFHSYQYTFIISKDFETHSDIFTLSMKVDYFFNHLLFIIVPIAVISLIIVILAALAVPYSYQNKVAIHRIYNKMFLELKGFIWISFFVILTIVFITILDGPVSRDLSGQHMISDLFYNPGINFYLISVPIVFTTQFLLYMSIAYLKYVYYTGFYKGFVLNSLFIKGAVTITKNLKKFIKELFSLNLRDNYHNAILRIVVVNLLVIWIIFRTGFIGFLIAVVYTIYLFNYLKSFIKNLKQVHHASEEISLGNFETALDEKDMGVLMPISQNLNKIKNAFELAVSEEIKSQKMKTELIANVSHDLKTPLTSIITYVDLLKKEESEEKRREYTDIIEQKSKRLELLIEDLFEASKTSSGNISLELEDIDVVALFRQTLGELEDKIKTSSLKFVTNLTEGKVICRLDGKRTYRIFDNIMSNILNYSMDNTRVYIDMEDKEDTVTFIFKNISAYEMNFHAEEITERFSRGDKSRNTEGSGLGLAIAKDLVELQEGSMEISIDGDLFKLALTFSKKK